MKGYFRKLMIWKRWCKKSAKRRERRMLNREVKLDEC